MPNDAGCLRVVVGGEFRARLLERAVPDRPQGMPAGRVLSLPGRLVSKLRRSLRRQGQYGTDSASVQRPQ
jgi:hypothetical protein